MFATVSAALKRLSAVCKAKILATRPVQKLIAYRTERRWATFKAQNPSLVEYTKPYRTPHDLVYKLMLQGLHVPDRKLAEATIFRENYYRFKAYAIPFLDEAIDKFHAGTDFR